MAISRAHSRVLSRWWHPIWILNAVCIAGTILSVGLWPKHLLLRQFNLGVETNFATWWEATQVLLFALLAQATAFALREKDRAASRAFTGLAVIGLAFFADEIGSLHERMGLIIANPAFRDLPAAILLAGGFSWSLWTLERRRTLVGNTARWVFLAFVILGLVYVQEIGERTFATRSWSKSLRTAAEEGCELVGIFILLVAAVRSWRRHRGEPLGSAADWRSLKWTATLAALFAGPVLFFRSGLSFDALRLPRLGDFGMVIPVSVFACAGIAAALHARQRPAVRAWWWLAAVMVGWSISAEVHLHRFLLGYVHWRYDLDLLAGLPFLAAATLSIPDLRRPAVYGGLLVLSGTVLLSIFAFERPEFPLINYVLTALFCAGTIFTAQPAPERVFMPAAPAYSARSEI